MTTILFQNEELPETFAVKVTPKATKVQVKLDHQEDGSPFLRVYVTAAPEDGKANKAVIALLAKELGIPKSSFEIIKGETNRNKVVRVMQ